MSQILEALLSQYDEATREVYLDSASQIAAVLRPGVDLKDIDWASITPSESLSLPHRLSGKYASSTVNKTLTVNRLIRKTAYAMGLMTADDYLSGLPENIPQEPIQQKQAISQKVVREIVKICRADKSLRGKRDVALITLLAATGLNRGDVYRLLLSDYDSASRRLLVRGKRRRSLRLSKKVVSALDDYINDRDDANPYLFIGILKGGRTVKAGPVTAQAVYLWIRERGEEAGYSDVSGNNLKKTMVSESLRKGVDVRKIQEKLGIRSADQVLVHDVRGKQCGQNGGR